MKANLTKVRAFVLAVFLTLALGVSSVQAQTYTYEVKGDSVANSTNFYFTVWVSATNGTNLRASQLTLWISNAFVNGTVAAGTNTGVTFVSGSSDVSASNVFSTKFLTPTAGGAPTGTGGDTSIITINNTALGCGNINLTTTPVRYGQFMVTRSGAGGWGCSPNKLGFYNGTINGGGKLICDLNYWTQCTPTTANATYPLSDGTLTNSHLNNQSPVITASPQATFVCGGSGVAQFSVTASSVNPGSTASEFTYQWLENGIALSENAPYSGTQTATLSLTNPSSGLNGKSYSCVVTQCGSTTSSGGILTVGNATPPDIGTITQPTCTTNTGSVALSGLPASGSWTIYPTPSDISPVSGSGASTSISGLTASSTYTFTITSSQGCSSGSSANTVVNGTLTVPGTPTAGTVTNPVCGTTTGSVAISGLPTSGSWTVNSSGASGNASSSTADGSGNGSVSGLNGSTGSVSYTFSVTNSQGCTSAASNSVSVTRALLVPSAAPSIGTRTQPSCGTLTGSVVLNNLPTTGSGAWTVTPNPTDVSPISGSGSSATISGLTGGTTYTFTVTNSDGCTSASSGNCVINASKITPDAPVVGTITNPTCGTPTGSVALSDLPSSGNWTLNPAPSGSNVAGSGSTYTFSNLAANTTFTFQVTNSDGCTSVASGNAAVGAALTVPGAPSIFSTTQPVCGTITGTVVLHSLPSSGTWTVTTSPGGAGNSGSGTSLSLSGLTAGTTYTFTVTNSVGCVSPSSANAVINPALTVPDAPVVGTVTQPTCATPTGTIALSDLPASGTWTLTPSYGSTSTGTGTTTTVSGIALGNISFTVTNSPDGCTSAASTSTNLTNASAPSTPVVGTITQPVCGTPTGSVALSGLPSSGNWTVTPSSGSTKTGSGTTTTVTGLAAGTTYTFTVTNASSCTSGNSGNAVVSAALVTPSAPVVGTVTQPTCASQSGSAALSGLPSSGNWTVHPSSGVISTGSGTNAEITGLALNTTFTFTVTNSSGCTSGSSSGNAVIGGATTAPATPTVYTLLQATCGIPTGTIVFNSESGVNYGVQSSTYNGGVASYGSSASISGLPAGTYTLSVQSTTDASCVAYAASTVALTAPLGPPATPTVTVTQPTCVTTTGTITFATEAGVKYIIGTDSSANRSFPGLATGTYTPTVIRTADQSCAASASPVTLSASGTNTPATPEISLTQDADCSHSTATINVTSPDGSLEYSINGGGSWNAAGNGTFSGLSHGSYTVIAKYADGTGCYSLASNSVTVSAASGTTPSITALTPGGNTDTTFCSGNRTAIYFTSSLSGTTYTWTVGVANGTVTGPISSHGSAITQLINNVGTTTALVTYTVIGTRNGCSSSAIATVSVYPKATAVATPSPDYICSGTTAGITIGGDVNTFFTWTVSAGANLSGTYASCSGSSCGSFINDVAYNSGILNSSLIYNITAWNTITGAQSCPGNVTKETVVVRPVPVATQSSTNSPVCSGVKTNVLISSLTGGTIYNFTAGPVINPTGGVITGDANGTGAGIKQYLINSGTTTGTVFYTITPSYYGCLGSPIQVSVDVRPVPTGFANQTSADTIIPGGTTNIVLQYSFVDNTTFTWIPKHNIFVTGTDTCNDPHGLTGICGTLIANTLYNLGAANQTQGYTITPWANGCAGPTFVHNVQIRPVPVAHQANFTICSGSRTKILLSSVPGGSSYAWATSLIPPTGGTITGFSDGTSAADGTVIYNTLVNTGTTTGQVIYAITPTYYRSVGNVTYDTVTVNPVALGTASPSPIGICNGGNVGITLNATISGIGTYFTWTTLKNNYVFGESVCTSGCATSINDNLTTSLGSSVEVYVITPWTAGCAGTAFQDNVTVSSSSLSPATPTISGSVIGICPEPQTYTYTVTNLAAYNTVTWTLPTGCTYAGYTLHSNPIVISFPDTYMVPFIATQSVSAIVTNLCGVNSASASLKPTPTGGIAISGSTSGLCGASGITYTVGNFPGHSYSWSGTAGITVASGGNTSTATFNFSSGFTSGTVTCDVSGCGSDQIINLGVSGAPAAPGLISGPTTHCSTSTGQVYSVAAVSGASSYVWTLPPGGTPTVSLTTSLPTITVNYASSSSGNLTVAAANSCTTSVARSERITVNCREAGTPDIQTAGNDVVAYPNPAHDKLNVVFNSSTAANYSIRLMDITGRIVLSQVNAAQEGTNVLQLDLTNYAKGIYNLSVATTDGSKQIRITVE